MRNLLSFKIDCILGTLSTLLAAITIFGRGVNLKLEGDIQLTFEEIEIAGIHERYIRAELTSS